MVTRRRISTAHLYIEEWMQHLGLTDESLGLKMDKSRVTVWRWRTEQKRLNPDKIAAIAGALGLSSVDLWRPPWRPSLDAIVQDAPDEIVQKAADIVRIVLKTGT